MYLSRRKLLKIFGMASAATVVSSGLQGCGGGSAEGNTDIPEIPILTGSFQHGIASGDPLHDRVIIWTRITSENEAPLTVSWQVATDAEFVNLVNQDSASVTAATDYTLKVDVIDLAPATEYYYRFFYDGDYSPIGKTKTLPEGSLDSAKFAIFSCANYPAGFFHIYGAAAQRASEYDAVIHIGDYIYEYDKDGYADAGTGEDINRVHNPVTECISLEDYRTRYAQYHTDWNLQELHALLPFICVWDDHEIANDTYKDGAENHQDDEGSFADRRAAGIQAWYEWLPVRAPQIDADKIKTCRRFDFGNLLSLMMLDTRVIGRDEQLNYFKYFAEDGSFDQAGILADLSDENRSMLGPEQEQWLEEQLTESVDSGIKWQALGQQVLMARMHVPGSVLSILLQQIPDYDFEHISDDLPYNLDAWDGYPVAREKLYNAVQNANANLVVMAGDTHNGWASNLANEANELLGVEFATASVSSPGLEEYISIPEGSEADYEKFFTNWVDDLQYCNVSQRGFLEIEFTPEFVTGNWYYIPRNAQKSWRTPTLSKLKTLRSAHGNPVLIEDA